MHPSISVKVLNTGIMPTLNRNKWISPDIPYSTKEVERVYGKRLGKPYFWSWVTWFRKCTNQRYQFSHAQAVEVDKVTLNEVGEAINIAKSLQSLGERSRLN